MLSAIANVISASIPYLVLSTLAIRPADAVFDHDRQQPPLLAVLPPILGPDVRPPLQPREHDFVSPDVGVLSSAPH